MDTNQETAEAPQDENLFRAGGDPIEAEDLSMGIDALDDPDYQSHDEVAALRKLEAERAAKAAEEEAAATGEEPPVSEETGSDELEEAAAEETAEQDLEPAEAEAEAEVAPVEAQPEESADAEQAETPDIRIPKQRLDQEVAKRRAVENQLKELQSRMNTGTDTLKETLENLENIDMDLGDLPKKMFDKALDGDLDDANQIFMDIIQKSSMATAQVVQSRAAEQARAEATQAMQMSDEQRVIAELEATHEFYNPASESFDADAVSETLTLQEAFLAKGYTRADAMQTAANYYVAMHRPATPEQPASLAAGAEGAEAATRAVQQKPAPKPRAPEEVQRNVAAAQAQPPVAEGVGNETVDPGLPDITMMSQEEIDALPEATRRRLRGDYL